MLATGQNDPHLYITITNRILEYNNIPKIEIPEEVQEQTINLEIEKMRIMRQNEQEHLRDTIYEMYNEISSDHGDSNPNRKMDEIEDDYLRNKSLEERIKYARKEENRSQTDEEKRRTTDEEKVESVLGKAPPSNFSQDWYLPSLPHNQKRIKDNETRETEDKPGINTGARQKDRKLTTKTRSSERNEEIEKEKDKGNHKLPETQDSFNSEFMLKGRTRSSERLNQLYREKEIGNYDRKLPDTQDSFNSEFMMKEKITKGKGREDGPSLNTIEEEFSDSSDDEDVEIESDGNENNEQEDRNATTEDEENKEEETTEQTIRDNNKKEDTSSSDSEDSKETNPGKNEKQRRCNKKRYNKEEFVKVKHCDEKKKRKPRRHR